MPNPLEIAFFSVNFAIALGLVYFIARMQHLFRGGVFQRSLRMFLLTAIATLLHVVIRAFIGFGTVPSTAYLGETSLTLTLVLALTAAFLNYGAWQRLEK